MAGYSYHLLIMGKVEIVIFYSHSRYYDKFLMVMSLEISSTLCMNLV